MVVLQFGFGEDGTHRPNNYVRNLVSFTGTHDNNTTRGWWNELRKAANTKSNSTARAELNRTKAYLQSDGREIWWSFIQAVVTSVADVSMIPLQDILGLGSTARMNTPGRAKGSWHWRYSREAITPAQIEWQTKSGIPLTTVQRIVYTEVDPPRRLRYRNIIDFVPDVEAYEVDNEVDFEENESGVRIVIRFSPLHSDEWSRLATLGYESQLSHLEAVLVSRRWPDVVR